MITRFRVKNYKCLGDVDFPLTPIHVIIGQNDSGKTSVLEAIHIVSKSTIANQINDAFSSDWNNRELVNNSSDQTEVSFGVTIGEGVQDDSFPIDHDFVIEFPNEYSPVAKRSCFIKRESMYITAMKHQVHLTVRPGSTVISNRLILPPSSHERMIFSLVADSLYPSMYFNFDPKIMALPAAYDISRKFSLHSDGFGLSTLLDDILGYELDLFKNLRDGFCEFFPQFKSIRLETENAVVRFKDHSGADSFSNAIGKCVYFETKSGRSIRADQVSDGAILFLGFLALMYNPKPPKLILIEEPEKGIYPKRLEEVIGMMRRLVENPGDRPVPQIVMTTHSPYLLSLFQPEEVTFLRRENGTGPVRAYPMRDAPHIHERLENGLFYLGELWYNYTEEELFADGK